MSGWEDAPSGWEDAPAPKNRAMQVLTNQPAVAMGEATAAMGSGAIAGPLGGYAGLVGSMLPGPEGQGADWSQRVQNALTYEPRTSGGQAYTGAVAAPFAALANVADKAGGAVTDATGSPALGAATNTLLQAAPMAVGKVVPKVAGAFRKTVDPRLQAAGDAGFKITPEEADAGAVSKTAAGLSGEPRLARKIANSNAALATEKIVDDLKLPKGTELSHETLENVREQQGAAYEKLRQAGEVQVDKPFINDLREIVKDYEGASKDFPRGQNPVMDVYKRLTQNPDGSIKRSFDANSAVSEIKNLRKDAKRAYTSGDSELGGANLAAAKALEDSLDRHISKPTMGSDMAGVPGDTAAVSEFRKARELIAKTYDAEKALGPQGEINPQVYAKMLAKGKKLSGASLEIAQAARDFPRSMMKPSTMGTGPSAADIAMGVMMPWKGLAMLARPATRSIIASEPYQSAFIRNPGSLTEALSGSGDLLPGVATVGESNVRNK